MIYKGQTPLLKQPKLGSNNIEKIYRGNRVVYGTPDPFSTTGGTITQYDGYTIHTFTVSSDFVYIGRRPLECEILLVGGGAGGGGGTCNIDANSCNGGGAGGAGGVVLIPSASFTISDGSYSVVVGKGGEAYSATYRQTTGSASTFAGLTALGGGGPTVPTGIFSGIEPNLTDGGSGGGQGAFNAASFLTSGSRLGLQSTLAGLSGQYGYGNNGGASGGGVGGGGGGATSAGGNGGAGGGLAGSGLTVNFNGTSIEYGRGGLAMDSSVLPSPIFLPNVGWGGAGNSPGTLTPFVNTATSGSDGVVMIRYKTPN
jgi:hypothetical protein